MFSATLHLTILSVSLLLLGAVMTPTYHSVAPAFDAAVNTVVGDGDMSGSRSPSSPSIRAALSSQRLFIGRR